MRHLESQLQSEIVKYLRARGLVCHSIPNDFVKNARAMGTAISMGLLPGVADLVVWWPSGIGYLEVKIPGGKLSKSQINFQSSCKSHGIRYDVVWSMDDLKKLK